MNFAEAYSERYSVAPKIFDDNPRSDTGIIVVIPCYDDEFIFTTLQSLDSAKVPSCSLEVIVVVNSAEDTEAAIVEKNNITAPIMLVQAMAFRFSRSNLWRMSCLIIIVCFFTRL